eukprot:3397450-Rhodomonas_salina.2
MAVITIYYAAYCIDAYYSSEAKIEQIIAAVINGPLFQGHNEASPDGIRFEAVQLFEDALAEADRVSTFAFVMMVQPRRACFSPECWVCLFQMAPGWCCCMQELGGVGCMDGG